MAYACLHCHNIVDGQSGGDVGRRRYIMENYPTAYFERLLNGLVETQARLIMQGIVQVPDGEII